MLYLAWREPGRRWWPVGRLVRRDGEYEFAYTRGAVDAEPAGFRPLVTFPDRSSVYRSQELFPLFANRLMNPARSEFDSFVAWLDLPRGERDPLVLLSRSGGRRETDVFEVFAAPERTPSGRYRMPFFVHGLRHRDEAAQQLAQQLVPGEPLQMSADPENPADPEAVAIMARGVHIGFAPRYLRRDLNTLRHAQATDAALTVTRANAPPTPLQFRVLATFDAQWPDGFQPFSGPEFEPLRPDLAAVA